MAAALCGRERARADHASVDRADRCASTRVRTADDAGARVGGVPVSADAGVCPYGSPTAYEFQGYAGAYWQSGGKSRGECEARFCG